MILMVSSKGHRDFNYKKYFYLVKKKNLDCNLDGLGFQCTPKFWKMYSNLADDL